MVIPDEVKRQLLYHYPNSNFKIKHGCFYVAELYYLSTKQFFYGNFKHTGTLFVRMLHFDGTIRQISTINLNPYFNHLIKSTAHDNNSDPMVGYLIEII